MYTAGISHYFRSLPGRLSRLVLVSFLLISLSPHASAQDGGPTATVRTTVEAILEILRRPDFNFARDREAISTEIRRAFDETAMAQSVLSTNWRDASEEQQNEFKELLMKTIESTYIDRVKAYTNETVEFTGEEINNNRAEVRTMIKSAGGDIPIIYKLRQRSDGWFVYDVEIENVSMVSTYRETYRSVARRSGIDGMLEQMRENISELEAGGNA